MENAVEGLKIAFAVIVFTIALSLAMATFSQARETSQTVLYMNDKTNYYDYDEIGEPTDMGEYTQYEIIKSDGTPGIVYTDKRIVGIETIIPTLYRYYKENYTVIFDGISSPIYHLDSTNKWDKNYTSTTEINYFDLNTEIKANCPWVGTVNDIKKNLDLFLKGTTLITDNALKSFGNINRTVKYNGFIEEYADNTFLEELGEYATDRTYGMNNGFLEVQDEEGNIAKFEQVGNLWICRQANNDFSSGESSSLENIATTVGSSASTFLDPDSGEIIELAKPTIKRVIKYTLQ